MNTCAHCGRKLLSQMSARCNWCGVEIRDSGYQARAEVERAAYFAEQALHDLQALSIVQGKLPPDPISAILPWRKSPAADTSAPLETMKPGQSERQDRFNHLEL